MSVKNERLEAMNNIFGIVSNKLIMDNEIDNIIISVFVTIRTLFYDINRDCSTLNINTLLDVFKIKGKRTENIKPIKESLQWLIENNHIEINDYLETIVIENVNDIDNSIIFKVRFVNTADELSVDGGFTKIPEINLLNILRKVDYQNKYKMIRYYCVVARICSNSNSFGQISQDKIHKICGVSNKTCSKYNEMLYELETIYFNNRYYRYDKKGKLKMTSTYFGHRNAKENRNVQEDKNEYLSEEFFNEQVESYVSGRGYILKDK
jgi:hypothetical protein